MELWMAVKPGMRVKVLVPSESPVSAGEFVTLRVTEVGEPRTPDTSAKGTVESESTIAGIAKGDTVPFTLADVEEVLP